MMTSVSELEGVIWFDGEFVNWRDAKVHVLTHTLHYGMGVFEGIRAYPAIKPDGTNAPSIFRLEDHTKRLFRSAHILGMEIPFHEDDINQAVVESVRKNKVSIEPSMLGYIRPMVFFGSEAMGLRAEGLKVHVIVAAWNWGKYIDPSIQSAGMKVGTSSFTRHHVNISMCKAKCNGHYVNSTLALNEAIRHGYDEALLLDNEGYVAEGTGENFFLVRDGVLHTPELTSCLDGITRDTILQLAKERGIECRERRITRDEVYIADEAFFTGTAAEIASIASLDNRIIGGGNAGPITKALSEDYFELVKKGHHNWPHWLTYV